MAVERINVQDVHPIVWGDHFHRYKWASEFCTGRVLDVACGVGYGSEPITSSNNVSQYIGIDISMDALQHGENDFGKESVEFCQADCNSLPLKHSSIDIVVCFETLEHLEAPEKLIEQFSFLLKPSGIFIGSVPSDEQEGLINVLYGSNIFHKTQFDMTTLLNLLQKYFGNIKILKQSVEICSFIRISDLPFQQSADFIENPRFRSFAPGNLLFFAWNGNDKDIKINEDELNVLPMTSLFQYDTATMSYVRSLENKISDFEKRLQTEESKIMEKENAITDIKSQLEKHESTIAGLKQQINRMAEQLQTNQEFEKKISQILQTIPK